MKVLYCCAFAHYTGHFPSSALHETEALKDNGVSVILLTFKGLADNTEPKVSYLRVDYESGWFGRLLIKKADALRQNRITRRLSMFIEWCMVLDKAIKLKKEMGFDVIHLRDGEPFPFLVHLFGCFNKDLKFLVSFTGTNLLQYRKIQNIGTLIYLGLLKFVNSKIWMPIYRRSLAKNSFVFTAQNEIIQDRFKYEFMGGILDGRVHYHPLGVTRDVKMIDKMEARHKLRLPKEAFIYLLFGNIHAGKDMLTPFKALSALRCLTLPNYNAKILQAGDDKVLNAYFNDVKAIADYYGVLDDTIVHNWYIRENKKALYFCASDVCILSYHSTFASTPSVLWEAVRHRTPVVITDMYGLGDMVRDYKLGLSYEPNNWESLAKAMNEINIVLTFADNDSYFGFDRFLDDFSSKRWAERCKDLYSML